MLVGASRVYGRGGEANVRLRHQRLFEPRIELERLIDRGDSEQHFLGVRIESPGSDIQVAGPGIGRGQSFHAHSLGCRQLDAQLPRYVEGDFALHRENVAPLALVRIGPQSRTCRAIGEAWRDSEVSLGAVHPTVEHCCYIQIAADLRDRALLAGSRAYGNYAQATDLGQLAHYFVLHARSEIRILGIGAQVLERQHGDGAWAWRRLLRRSAQPVRRTHGESHND